MFSRSLNQDPKKPDQSNSINRIDRNRRGHTIIEGQKFCILLIENGDERQARVGGTGGGGEGWWAALGCLCTTLVLFGLAGFPTEKGMAFRVLSVQFHYLASLTGCVFGTEEYDGCR